MVDTDKFIREIQPLSFNHYGLQNAFRSQNSIPLHENVLGMLKFLGVNEGELNDSSWLDSGKKLQATRTKQLATRQRELAISLPLSFSTIKNDLEKCIQKMTKIPHQSFSSEEKHELTEDLELILSCFNQKNEFNILQFKKILLSIHPHDVYTQKLIEDLENLCHEAIIFSLAKDKKVKLGLPSYPLSQSHHPIWTQESD